MPIDLKSVGYWVGAVGLLMGAVRWVSQWRRAARTIAIERAERTKIFIEQLLPNNPHSYLLEQNFALIEGKHFSASEIRWAFGQPDTGHALWQCRRVRGYVSFERRRPHLRGVVRSLWASHLIRGGLFAAFVYFTLVSLGYLVVVAPAYVRQHDWPRLCAVLAMVVLLAGAALCAVIEASRITAARSLCTRLKAHRQRCHA